MNGTHKHNGTEVREAPHVDFIFDPVDVETAAPELDLRQSGIEFDIAQRMVVAIAKSGTPATSAEQILWIMGWTKLSTRDLAKRAKISQPAFLCGAQKMAVKIGLKLSEAQLAAATEATG